MERGRKLLICGVRKILAYENIRLNTIEKSQRSPQQFTSKHYEFAKVTILAFFSHCHFKAEEIETCFTFSQKARNISTVLCLSHFLGVSRKARKLEISSIWPFLLPWLCMAEDIALPVRDFSHALLSCTWNASLHSIDSYLIARSLSKRKIECFV